MGFWSAYETSLKSRDVEEPIDLWLHRPAGYVVAKATFPTPISPNQITVASILVGWMGSGLLLVDVPGHFVAGGVCLVLSAVLDCADGQLARMRRSSSALGRMLDGIADLLTMTAAVAVCTWIIWTMYRGVWWQGALAVIGALLTVWTSQFHTTAHDHYKNVYLRLTVPGCREGEDLEAAIARMQQALDDRSSRRRGLVVRAGFGIYLGYLRGQRRFLGRFDPWCPKRLDLLPEHDEQRAAIVRARMRPGMRLLSSMFGVGGLVFSLAVFVALGRPDLYLALRLVVLNAIFWGVVGPRLRASSREALAALPELRAAVDGGRVEPAGAPATTARSAASGALVSRLGSGM